MAYSFAYKIRNNSDAVAYDTHNLTAGYSAILDNLQKRFDFGADQFQKYLNIAEFVQCASLPLMKEETEAFLESRRRVVNDAKSMHTVRVIEGYISYLRSNREESRRLERDLEPIEGEVDRWMESMER